MSAVAGTPAPGAWARLLRLQRDERVRRAFFEAITVGLAVTFALYLLQTTRGAGQLDLSFLSDRAGVGLGDQFLTHVNGNSSRWAYYFAGIMNTIRVTLFGNLIALALGLLIGVARLSSNWLAAHLALWYVEAIRNTPLLVFVVFFYTAVVLQFPRIQRSITLGGIAYFSNRAIAFPWVRPVAGAGTWGALCLGILVIVVAVWTGLHRLEETTGTSRWPWRVSLLLGAALVAVAFVATGLPLRWNIPVLGRYAYHGGMWFSPEFVGLTGSLALFNAAFVGEIVRGAIQSVPRGEREAAAALGLSPWQQLSQVVLPQALPVMLPPLATACQNLAKYSPIAIVIGFPDLLTVGGTIINNAGEAIPMFVVMSITYLLLNLLIALIVTGPQWRLLGAARRRL